jgi:hypothetical protein
MVLQDSNDFVTCEVSAGQPAWKLIVPDQRVTSHLHVVGLGEINERISIRKIESGS